MALLASCSGLYFPDGESVDNIVTLTWRAPATASAQQPRSVVLFKVKASNPHKFYIVPRYGTILVSDDSGRKPPQPPAVSITFGLRPQSDDPLEPPPPSLRRDNSDRFAIEYLLVVPDAATHEHLTQELSRPHRRGSNTVETAARELWEQVSEGKLKATQGPTVFLQAYTRGVVRALHETQGRRGEGFSDHSHNDGGDEASGTATSNASTTATAMTISNDNKHCNSGAAVADAYGSAVRNNSDKNRSHRAHNRAISSDEVQRTASSVNSGSHRSSERHEEEQVVVPPNARLVTSMIHRKLSDRLRRDPACATNNDGAAAGPTSSAGGGELQALKFGIKALRSGPRIHPEEAASISQMKTLEADPGMGGGSNNIASPAGTGTEAMNGIPGESSVGCRRTAVADVIMRIPPATSAVAAVKNQKGIPLTALLVLMFLSYGAAAFLVERMALI
ncbi:uncharacterized protein TEOVI_000306400 [Trypanosoma equiperdum]|uniref:MSP domain-containing protein n=1 Tax=Trypanosoma equiperdum TaxID=5694 RepID=A0A1G4IGH7_TRYEQ|nr:hypothetical protein, conserved [Trypanosoma equiperdum]